MKNDLSRLRVVIQEAYKATDVDSARNLTVDFLKDPKCGIGEERRNQMMRELGRQVDLVGVWRYLTNALLRFEGMGIQDQHVGFRGAIQPSFRQSCEERYHNRRR